ncbi:hypothetical protein THAOC_14418, partial [Thalassiosira oceanica]
DLSSIETAQHGLERAHHITRTVSDDLGRKGAQGALRTAGSLQEVAGSASAWRPTDYDIGWQKTAGERFQGVDVWYFGGRTGGQVGAMDGVALLFFEVTRNKRARAGDCRAARERVRTGAGARPGLGRGSTATGLEIGLI